MKRNTSSRWFSVKRRISFGLLLFLVGCSSGTDQVSYDQFESVFEWEDIDGLDEKDYMIYYYNRDFFGTECAGCQIVKAPVLEYGLNNDEDITLLLINERTVRGIKPTLYSGQPMVVVISNNKVITSAFSALKILELLEIMNEETFELDELMIGEKE